MNKTFKQFVEGMLPKTEKGINSAMKKGLDKLDQKYQREYDDRKYPLDKKAQNVWKIWCKALGQKEGKSNREADAVAVIRTLILLGYMITNSFIMAGVVRHWNDGGSTPGGVSTPNRLCNG